MTYQLFHRVGIDNQTDTLVVKLNDDGSRLSFVLNDENPNMIAYQEWLAEGNEPEEWTGE